MTKNKMVSFITSLDKYPTMNSWNNSFGYSFNVKIHSLPITAKQKNALYDLIDSEDFYDGFNLIIEDFNEKMAKFGTHQIKKEIQINIENLSEKEIKERQKFYEKSGWTYERHGTSIMTLSRNTNKSIYSAGFNGRSGGHIVLYRWNGYNDCGTGWTHDKEELEEMTTEEIKAIYDIVKEFEKLYKNIVKQAEYLADNFVAKEEDYQITKTKKVLIEK